MLEIIPGILEKEWDAIEWKLSQAEPFAKSIHVDILDGKFAPNTTWLDPRPFAKYREKFFFELHMMAEDPLQYVKPWANAGFRRFIGQIEMMPDQNRFVDEVRSGKMEVGLAIDVGSAVENITVPFEDLNFLFVMTVKAGFSNQSFLPEQLDKVRAIREKTDKPIEVDGGINDQTIIQAKQAGATRFVSTSFLFKSSGAPDMQYHLLLSACGG